MRQGSPRARFGDPFRRPNLLGLFEFESVWGFEKGRFVTTTESVGIYANLYTFAVEQAHESGSTLLTVFDDSSLSVDFRKISYFFGRLSEL